MPLLVVELLGATVCALTQDRLKSERHIANQRRGRERGRAAEDMAALEASTADKVRVQVRLEEEEEGIQRALSSANEGTFSLM